MTLILAGAAGLVVPDGQLTLGSTAVTSTAAELNYVDGVTSNVQTQLDAKAALAGPTFTGTPAAPTAGAGTNTTQLATTAFVTAAIATTIDSAPGALDTLNELAAALGDDANFSTTVTNLITANETHIDNVATLSGVAKDSTHLATFTGSTISDNQTVKAAIQALETAVETKQATDAELTELATMASTTAAALADLLEAEVQILDGATLSTTELNYVDGVTSAIQTQLDAKLASSGAQAALHVDHIITLSGVAQAADNLGTFTGGTIADSATIKAALQALETKVEAVQSDVDGNEGDADTAIAANETHIDNAATLSGVAKDATNLGTFTGSTVSDSRTVKQAIQELETKVEAVQTDVDGNESDADTAIAANETHIDNAVTLTGVAKDSTHLGTFTGSTISDNGTIKAGIQELETAVETKLNTSGAKAALDVDHLITLSGVAAAADNLGTFTGGTIADSATVKAALQALETKVEAVQTDVDGNESDADTAIAANETHIDNAVTLTGVAKDSTHLATFTGSTISDNGTIKAGIQELETAVETKAAAANSNLTGTTVVAAIDLSGDIDCDGTANLDIVDIDGAVDMASTLIMSGGLVNASDDTAAASAGVAVNQLYRNGSIVMIRVS